MTIAATKQNKYKLKLIYCALTTGLPTFAYSGFHLDYDADHYNAARDALNAGAPILWSSYSDSICHEDVQTQMIVMGFPLKFIDDEGEGEGNADLTWELIKKNWKHVPNTIKGEFDDENWDADTADNLMQYVLFGEIVYG
jgi:hypothetical protein